MVEEILKGSSQLKSQVAKSDIGYSTLFTRVISPKKKKKKTTKKNKTGSPEQ